jgi:lipopolysaccharide/colanic/teichoic acid biosynthesis glycosyltransferase
MLCCQSTDTVLFRQTRIGHNQRRFRILKFRTLPRKGPHPRRATPLGAWMRRTGLDELPQLLNVLVGSMSLVGPRPLVPSESAPYRHSAPTRFLVRPGITGLAQIHGRHIAPRHRGRWDRAYVARQSFWLDLYILLRTIAPGRRRQKP